MFAATNQSESLPVSVACTPDEANKDIPCKNSLSHESHLAHIEPITPSDERRSLHTFLRAEMEILCGVLKLSVKPLSLSFGWGLGGSLR